MGQLLSNGFIVTFDKSSCLVASKASGKVLVEASMTQNKLFPVDLTRVETCALIAQKEEVTALWLRRYGHVNINNLKMLQQKEMVKGMPMLGTLDIYEVCIMANKVRNHSPQKRHGGQQKFWNWFMVICVDQCKLKLSVGVSIFYYSLMTLVE